VPDRRFFRDNLFLVAAVALPLAVAGFFVLATAIPRWSVPPPAYDLVLRAAIYDRKRSTVPVDFTVRDGRVEATVRRWPAETWTLWTLLLFDHQSLTVREIPLDLPASLEPNEPYRTVIIEALKDRRVIDQIRAPDGYEFQAGRSRGGPGMIGALFGMNGYDRRASLVNNGRTVPITLPSPDQYYGTVAAVGWVTQSGQR
jgi:hypothetical protein